MAIIVGDITNPAKEGVWWKSPMVRDIAFSRLASFLHRPPSGMAKPPKPAVTQQQSGYVPMLKRTLYTAAAVLALFIGALGLIVPIIPGILFVALAVVLFANASQRFRRRLHASPRTRPYLVRWENSSALPTTDRIRLAGLLLYAAAADSLAPVTNR